MHIKGISGFLWILVFAISILQITNLYQYSLVLSALYALLSTVAFYLYTIATRNIIIRRSLPYTYGQPLVWMKLLCSSLVIALVLIAIDYFIETLNDGVRSSIVNDTYPFWSRLLIFFILSVIVSGIIYAFELYLYHMNTIRHQQQLKQEVLELELKSIRHQLSPHFTFNILNNLQFLIQKSQKEALLLLSQYSKVLRYYIYESQNKVIALNDELSFIRNYLSIEQQRLGSELNLQTRWEVPEDNNFMIAPFILSTFVENAFKHLSQKKKLIHLDCSLEGDLLTFLIKNSFDKDEKKESGGIGLISVIKRLEYIYADHYELNISNDESLFSVELRINL